MITLNPVIVNLDITLDPPLFDVKFEFFPQKPPGADGAPFTYEDFTPEQLAALKGEKGDAFLYSDFTPEQLEALKVKGDKGDAFEYSDFTPEQLAVLKGEKGDAFEYADFTPEQLEALKGGDGKSAYQSYLETTPDNPPMTEQAWSDQLGTKQTKSLSFSNKSVLTTDFVVDTTYVDYGFKAVITCTGVTSTDVAEVIFAPTESDSGNFASVTATGTDTVTIYAKAVPSATITIPTILITKL